MDDCSLYKIISMRRWDSMGGRLDLGGFGLATGGVASNWFSVSRAFPVNCEKATSTHLSGTETRFSASE